MATTDAPTPAAPAIENQIIAYRALSPLAVTSMLLGLVSVLSFAGDFFYLFSVAAVLTGIAANRKIRRFPDMLTGAPLAKAGIVMGLTFGLASFTFATVQGQLQKRSADSFARLYVKILQEGDLGEALWYQVPAQSRKLESPKQLIEKMRATEKDESNFQLQYAQLMSLKTQLASPGAEIHYHEIESHVINNLDVLVSALADVHVPESKDQVAKEQHALVVMKGSPEGGTYSWIVEGVRYPYTPKSFVPAPTKAHDDSDGHGHSH